MCGGAHRHQRGYLYRRDTPFGTPRPWGADLPRFARHFFARGSLLEETAPCATPRETRGARPSTPPLRAGAETMLHALCKGLLAKLGAAFDLVCSLPPLPLCGGVSFPLPRLSTGRSVVSDRTHVSFRTRSAAAAAEREAHQIVRSSCTPILFPKGWLPSAVRGSRAQPLRSLGFQRGYLYGRDTPFDIAPRGARQNSCAARGGCVAESGTATRETGAKAGYAESMSRAAAANAQRERILLFSFFFLCFLSCGAALTP